MLLKNEELISRYFERKMTSAEEQNFLISLAASDEMRIAFRSHLELMKAVRSDKDDLRQAAQVRTRTFAALGLMMSPAVDSFLEQSLLKQNAEKTTPAMAGIASGGFLSSLARVFRSSIATGATGLLIGFGGAALVFNAAQDEQSAKTASHSAAVSTPTVQNSTAPSSSKEAEVIPASQSDQATTTVPSPAAGKVHSTPSRQAETISSRNALVSSGSVASDRQASAPKSAAETPQVVDRVGKGAMTVQPLKIQTPDSLKAR